MRKPDDPTLLLPSLGLVLGGALWGLFWLPVRAIADLELNGGWPGAVIYAGALLLLSPLIALRRRRLAALWRPLALCGLFTGAAFSLYSTSLLLSDVVRVILLFYLTPIWGTLLGVAFLGERLTANRLLALSLGVAGLLVVLGIGERAPWPANVGDWLALASGVAWAVGSLQLYRMGDVAAPEQMAAFVVGSLVVTLATIAFGGPVFGGPISAAQFGAALPCGVLCALYVLPMLFLTVWPATMLTPGRVGILLMSDVVVGVASAAALAGEPFGVREFLGALLVVAAAVVEVLGRAPTVER